MAQRKKMKMKIRRCNQPLKLTFLLALWLLFLGVGSSVKRIKAFTITTQLHGRIKSSQLRSLERGQMQPLPQLQRNHVFILKGQKRTSSGQGDGDFDKEREDDETGAGTVDYNNRNSVENGIRLNKVFKATHSRREADALIASGRVCVNGKPVESKGGFFVIPFRDEISLDGNIIRGWEKMNAIVRDNSSTSSSGEGNKPQKGKRSHKSDIRTTLSTEQFEYVKYFKPLGVTCTTDLKIKDNIIRAIQRDGYRPRHRVFPVGRLDKETSGLILLTSDGRVINAVLRGEKKQPKIYKVMVDGRLTENHLQRLRDGITIRTVAQRTEGKATPLVAKTKPCLVERIGPCSCQMTLVEGRNRQIRKMMSALGFTVVKLHRVEFMGIQLADTPQSKGLAKPGDWAYLDDHEMKLVKRALRAAIAQ